MQIIHTNKSKEKNAPSKINKTEIPQNNKNSNGINSHNKIYDSSHLQDKKISTKIKQKKKEPILENLLIKDLDEFFKNIYNYYYNKGYNNILTQIILDNISYLFSIHFVILNIFIINWKEIILKCTVDNLCNSELSNNFSIQNFSEKISEHFFLFFFIYGFLIIYYLIFFFKSILQIINMKKIKNIYDYRLKIKQSELEHIKFDQIIHRLIILQDKESFCRIKENLTKYDIISRIMRKDNYMLALFTNNIIDSKIKFSLKIPFIQKKIFDFNFEIFSNFLYTKINESVIDFALNSMDKRVNVNFISLQTLRLKLIFFMFCECIFLIPSIFLKIIFWIFINADNIKSNRNITNKIWDRKNLILFRNYNELQHYFDYRITTSYKYLELFNNCFKSKQRLFNIVKRFLKLITGSILFIIFMISFFDNRLLTDMTIFGKNFVWLSIIVGVIISITNSEEEKDLKENPYTCLSDNNDKKFLAGNYLDCDNRVVYYKKLINCLINIPEEWSLAENFSKVNKEINNNYEMSFLMIVKEILSMVFFPVVWIKLIFNADEIRKFIIKNSCNFPDLGTICCFSYFNFENYKRNRAGSSRFVDYNFNDKKFLNSCFYYKVKIKFLEIFLEFLYYLSLYEIFMLYFILKF